MASSNHLLTRKHKPFSYLLIGFLIAAIAYFFIISQSNIVSQEKQPQMSQLPRAVGAGKIIKGSFAKDKFKSDLEWQAILSPAQYSILREEGTETPFTGELLHEKRSGTYYSAGCDEPLFSSETKYETGTGWPSFWAPINEENVVLREDTSLPGSPRIEVLDRCGNHLGHVFDDGPEPTGKRYCMNSAALRFVPDKE